jgi:hypothetical protein
MCSPTTLSRAIEVHQAAKSAWHSQTEDARNSAVDPLFDELTDAEQELVIAPTATDAELVQKLRYLFAAATNDRGRVVEDFDSVLAALDFHFADSNPDSATTSA